MLHISTSYLLYLLSNKCFQVQVLFSSSGTSVLTATSSRCLVMTNCRVWNLIDGLLKTIFIFLHRRLDFMYILVQTLHLVCKHLSYFHSKPVLFQFNIQIKITKPTLFQVKIRIKVSQWWSSSNIWISCMFWCWCCTLFVNVAFFFPFWNFLQEIVCIFIQFQVCYW